MNDTDRPQTALAALVARAKRGTPASHAVTAATAVAAGRVALGLAALARPDVPARPWVGASADGLAADVFGRALGGRDLALGLGALSALGASALAASAPPVDALGASAVGASAPGAGASPVDAARWLAAGALADALDVAATVAAWPELPRRTRWLVAASAGGAALAGAAGALALFLDRSH